MKRTLILWVSAALALAPSLSAQDASSDFDSVPAASDAASTGADAPAAPANLGTFKWSGDQEFAWRQGAAEDPTRTGGQVDGKLSAEYKVGDVKVVGAALVRDGEFVPGETLVQWAPGAFKVSAGLAEFSWGLADKKNPTDTLNARDYRYGADAARLVNPALTLAWYPAEWMSVEAVYEPWKDQSKFPKDFRANTQAGLDLNKSALVAGLSPGVAALAALTTTPSIGGLTAAQVATHLGSTFASFRTLVTAEGQDNSFEKPVYGGRANFFLPGVDLSLSYVYDWDTYYTPVVTMTSAVVPLTVLTGNPAYVAIPKAIYLPSKIDLVLKRIHRIGVNAKTTVDRYGLWVETAYNVTEDPSGTDDGVRNDKLSWTTGLDFNFGPGSAYYVNLQYAGEWVPGYDATTVKDYSGVATDITNEAAVKRQVYRSLTQSLGSETEEWMHTGTVSLKFPLADATVTPTLSGAVIVPVNYDETLQTRVASAFFKPEVDLAPIDGIHVLVGADLAYGWVKKAGSSEVSLDTATDKLGVYTPQNNVYVKVQYKWNGSLGN